MRPRSSSRLGPLVRALLALCALGLGACGSDASGFAGVRALNLCGDAYPVCNTAAGCVLSEDQYTEGELPGVQQVLFRTEAPATVRVRLLLLDRRSPGKTTQIEWNEVGCGGQQAYSTMGQDLFLLAGTTQQLSVERPLQTSGDHLIRLLSDATTRYQLRIETVKN